MLKKRSLLSEAFNIRSTDNIIMVIEEYLRHLTNELQEMMRDPSNLALAPATFILIYRDQKEGFMFCCW